MENIREGAAAARDDPEQLEAFIEKHKQFILYQAFKTVHHFVSTSDDEWSIALIAFSEAVNTWEEEKGPFKPFASLVIRRRLLDYIQSEARHASEVSVEPYVFDGELNDEEEEDNVNAQVRRSAYEFAGYADEESTPGSSTARDEIDAMQQTLKPYGFSFYDLTECSPKAEKTKRKCGEAVRVLVESEQLLTAMRRDRSLPLKQLCERSGVERKILERHRRYIIAAAEILSGEYPLLASYIGNAGQTGGKVQESA